MAFLASGEDPNFGLYSRNVHAAVRVIIANQDAATGIIGGGTGRGNMYHHGFAMLALAEAYGAVDDRYVWPAGKKPRSIGAALELAVRSAITSQKKNPQGYRGIPKRHDHVRKPVQGNLPDLFHAIGEQGIAGRGEYRHAHNHQDGGE